ncbi:hypothetical protein POX_c04758 [Penicillium oxalicum]|uniref:hypothetical protein n=1 Tax=Penicillium oxalicum TaxID=69781 RepID=UPI0020B7E86B|nr:hypothetical protein POX_c04758 [Penicillium oxalicum]KAI2791878.1 hypothetical protein POX_c04758 [Penicillium oxalicum]
MPGKRVTVRQATRSTIPRLLVGDHHTASTALHPLKYQAILRPWPAFRMDVQAMDAAMRWSNRTVHYTESSRHLDEEIVHVGDEHGVQGRFQQSVGSVIGHVCAAQGIDIHFADFKCIGSPYTSIPDVILKSTHNELKAVGEIKVPWIKEHSLILRSDDEEELREILAQPIRYMQDLNCMYGFLSTYDETIFLRQRDVHGTWRVEYSEVVKRYDSPEISLATHNFQAVSVRQCFLYFATIASQQGPVFNSTPKVQWVKRVTI